MKRVRHCQLPAVMSVTGRSSSITNAFINAIIPVICPSEAEELEALRILGMSPGTIQCVYCGGKHTEWDHFRPIIRNKEPTGYITEISNLVPACGKCNQSKGASEWRIWMEGTAVLSPKRRGIPDMQERISRLVEYEAWREPTKINFEDVVGKQMWELHRRNWQSVLTLLQTSQILASEIRTLVAQQVNKLSERNRE